jgi:hypothetical protein
MKTVHWTTYTNGGKVVMAVAIAFRSRIAASKDGITFARELSSPEHTVRPIVLNAFNAEFIRGSLVVEDKIFLMNSTMSLMTGVTVRRTASVTLCRRPLRASSAPPWIFENRISPVS